MKSKKSAVSNSGPLIHLAQANLLKLLRLYKTVIPTQVKAEVVDMGKAKGFSDAVLVEQAIERGLLSVVEVEVPSRIAEAAEVAGLHDAEIAVVYHAYKTHAVALLDEDAARVFATGLGITVRGSLGVLVEGVKEGVISYSESIQGLDRLSDIMYLSSDVYKLILKVLEDSKGLGE